VYTTLNDWGAATWQHLQPRLQIIRMCRLLSLHLASIHNKGQMRRALTHLSLHTLDTRSHRLVSTRRGYSRSDLDGAVLRLLELAGPGGAVDKEADGLALRNVVEGDEADVALGEGPLAGGSLLEHLVGVIAAEHGEFPHCPVAVVVVALHTARQLIGLCLRKAAWHRVMVRTTFSPQESALALRWRVRILASTAACSGLAMCEFTWQFLDAKSWHACTDTVALASTKCCP
jgi:hypothetical protein